jgi:hypothetical protein
MEELLKILREMADDLEHVGDIAVASIPEMGADMAGALREIADDLEQNVIEGEGEGEDDGEPEPTVREGRRWTTN